MSVQLPANSTGPVIATLTLGSKEYQQIQKSDGVTPTQLQSILLPGAAEALEIASARVSNHPLDGNKATYSACYVAQSVGTAATTAIFYLAGSATKIVRPVQLIVNATIATAGQEFDFALQKESVLPTGGTAATAATIVPWDSNDLAATATTKFYTATPTDGTVTGIVLVTKMSLFIAAATTVQPPTNPYVFNFGSQPGCKALVLRGAAQGIVATLSTATPGNASSWDVTWVWTEE